METTKIEHVFTRGEFLNNLEASTLLSAEELERARTCKPAADGIGLAHAIVQMGLLTIYQMDAICRGRHKELRIGNYDVLEKLGSGGMGTVFKARHRRMKRIVAIKVLAKNLLKDADFVRRFQREVETIARFNHPNIVLAFDADESELGHFLVMEFVDGQDLASIVQRRGPMAVADAVDCVLQSAHGMEYVHGMGMIHRDIKPANLLRDLAGAVKVTDLGLARFSGAHASSGSGITQAGGILGTVDFMPPEQAVDSSGIDACADIYSLGATLYFLLVGQPPYPGSTFMATLIKHREAPIPSLTAVRPDVPAELDAFCRKMMAKVPAQRPQSMSEVVQALSDMIERGLVAKLHSDAAAPRAPVVAATAAHSTAFELGPLPAQSAADSSQTVNLLPKATVKDRSALKILLVEPSRTQAGIIRKYLKDQDIDHVTIVATGKEAFAAVSRENPNAIICSLHLSDMTGIELAKQVRAANHNPMGFVLISTEAESTDAGTLSSCGPAVLLHKPFTPEKLLDSLSTVLCQPLAVKVADTAMLSLARKPGDGNAPGGGRQALRVLLVDDSAPARLHEKTVLQSLGFTQFVEAADGAQAVAAVARDRFDLIITDYNMPFMDGRGLVGYLKQSPATASVPILMITTESDPAKLDEVRRLGVTVCDKTFSAQCVRGILDSWFKPV